MIPQDLLIDSFGKLPIVEGATAIVRTAQFRCLAIFREDRIWYEVFNLKQPVPDVIDWQALKRSE